MLLITAALAAPLTYDDALDEALQANADLLGAQADVTAAEGSLLATRGAYDPQLGASLYTSANTSEDSLARFGFPGAVSLQDTDVNGWSLDLSQSFWTGTSWNIGWESTYATNSYGFYTTEGEPLSTGDDNEQLTKYFSNGLSLSLTQQLLDGVRLASNLSTVRASQRAVTSAQAAQLQSRQDVLSAAAAAYWDLYAAWRSEATAERAVEVATEEQRIVEAQVAAGNMAPIEATRVRAALAQARLDLITSRQAADAASDALAIVLGRSPAERITPETGPGEVPQGLDIEVDEAVAVALDGSPALQLAQLSVEGADDELLVARHERLPSLSITGSLGFNGYREYDILVEQASDPSFDVGWGEGAAASREKLFSLDYRNNYVGLELSTPLGFRVERGSVMSAGAGLEKARRDLEAAERSVAQQVAAQVRTIDSAYRTVELAELNLRLAEETLAAEKARQEVGRAIQKDVLEAIRARDEAEAGLVSALVEFRKALVALKALQGKL